MEVEWMRDVEAEGGHRMCQRAFDYSDQYYMGPEYLDVLELERIF
jgi:hypothetical protein